MNRFKNFSESGSKTITAAVNVAGRMGHITVGSEHLLMGILASGRSDASELLTEYDINFACVYNVVLNVMGCGQNTKLTEDDFSANAVQVLKNAYYTASAGGKSTAGVNEILHSIALQMNCMAYQILSTLTKNKADFFEKVQSLCLRKNMGAFQQEEKSEKKELKNLEKYSKNLTAVAKLTPFDPCIGREKEIRQLIEILLRRSKNNPCLVGLAGVGKTAIVEGLANMIVEGQVPDPIKNKSVYALDMAWVLAGTKYRGDFEERVKNIMDEAASDKDVILFIDEIHTIVSAGGAEGAIDAANIMKPALARGKVQIIGATTRDEYASAIEKDSALERRFCPIDVQEPSLPQTVEILQGLKNKYEEYHKTVITDKAISACVELSVKYINNRFLPDKAVDILDQSCAAAKVMGCDSVTEDVVVMVMAARTGVALTGAGERRRYINLENSLSAAITGQPQAVTAMAQALKRWRAGLKEEGKPIATMLLCGPTGVGKTYSRKVLADLLFPGENALVRIDCSEYSQAGSQTKLTGSPPGYVGYDEGGRLEKEILAHSGSVVLFDEIEKAHSDLHNLLLQIMDDGFVTTSRGKKISFGNCVIVLTSNATAELSASNSIPLGFEKKSTDSDVQVYSALRQHFSPEFLGRINHTVVFNRLDTCCLKEICHKSIMRLKERLAKQNITLETDENLTEFICQKSGISHSGARNISNTVAALLEDKISDMILSGRLSSSDTATVCVNNDKIDIKVYSKTK